MSITPNYYGSLCTQMYELLHPTANTYELEFYLSYAVNRKKILEPMCGSGRFMLPFIEKGYDISGFDLSKEMIDELLKKVSTAQAVAADMNSFTSSSKYDYIFIASSSFSLFTSDSQITEALKKISQLLSSDGIFVFGVESIHTDVETIENYRERCREKTEEGYDLVLKIKQHLDYETSVLHMPNLYELYDAQQLLQTENMDFRIRLYEDNELDKYLIENGFEILEKYNTYNKTIDTSSDLILYTCKIQSL